MTRTCCNIKIPAGSQMLDKLISLKKGGEGGTFDAASGRSCLVRRTGYVTI